MLIADSIDKNLGELKFGVPHSFNYRITNKDDKPITIDKVIVGCGSCTTATVSSKELSPGQDTEVNVVFTPGSAGIALKSVSIIYLLGGEVQPELKLTFRAKVNE